jgi:hypothetical protein
MSGYKFPDEQDDDKQVTADNGGESENEVKVTAEADEVEVEIVDDTPERDRGRKPLDREVADPTDDEIDGYSEGVKKRIKELTHARHDERRAKETLLREKQELERLAQHMVEENKRLKQYVQTGTEQYVASQVQVAENEVEKAKQQLKAATEAFDTEAIIAAQEALMEAKFKVQSAKSFKAPPVQEEKFVVQTAQQDTSPSELDTKTLNWQARNQWFGSPGYEELTSFALGLHQKLVNSGVDPRSDEYFERIDTRMKDKFPEVFGETKSQPKSGDGSRKPTTVVAPATRSTGAKKIQLTSTQIALAKKFGLTPQQYAAQVAKLEKSNG